MRDDQDYAALMKLIERGREVFRSSIVHLEDETAILRIINEAAPHLERHLRYAILDKNCAHVEEVIGAALDHVRTLRYSSQETLSTSSISRPPNEILLSVLIQPRDANALLGDLEELHNGTKSPAYWRDFGLAAITLLGAMIMKTMRLERVFKGNR